MDGFDRIIHLRATEKCDLRCKHCFVPPNASVMEEGLIIDQVETILASRKAGRSVLLQWHGGEPTLLPPSTVGRVITQLNFSAQRRGICLHHGIQTNLTAIHKSRNHHKAGWMQLLKSAFDPDQIGVSFDYGLRGAPAEDIFDHALRENLTDQGIRPWVTLTLARPLCERLMDDPLSVLKRFGRVRGIRFEPLSPHGYAKANWDEIGISHAQRCEAMIQVLEAWWPRRNYLPEISPLGEMLGSLKLGSASSACTVPERIAMTEIDKDGVHERCIALQGKTPTPGIPLSCLRCDWQAVCRQGCSALPFFDESQPSIPGAEPFAGECRGGAALWSACRRILDQENPISEEDEDDTIR